jgi:hypothetical protein
VREAAWFQLWQNRLNYAGSSALVIVIQSMITQRTSNGTTHWSVGSPPETTMVQQDRNRFTSHEGEFTITVQLINFLFTDMQKLLQTLFQLKVKLRQQCLNRQAKQLVHAHSRRKINMRLHTSQRLTPCSAQGLVSLGRVTASRGRIPLHGLALWNRSWPRRTIRGVLEAYT